MTINIFKNQKDSLIEEFAKISDPSISRFMKTNQQSCPARRWWYDGLPKIDINRSDDYIVCGC